MYQIIMSCMLSMPFQVYEKVLNTLRQASHRVYQRLSKQLFYTNVLFISRPADCQNVVDRKRVEHLLFNSRQDEGVKEKKRPKPELERLRDSSTSKSRTRARKRTTKARPDLMWVMRKRSCKDQLARVPKVT
jgi:hypothetical protein